MSSRSSITGTTTEPRWEELWQAFHRVAEARSSEAGRQLLAGLDPTLRRDVEELLAAHQSSGAFLDAPAPECLGLDPWLGREIGPYRLTRRLGEGGMGVVYLADQSAPVRRRVALKIVHDPRVSEDALRRFRAERQVLVLMGHGNIAGALEVGALEVDGREIPWMTMEWVAGLPIDAFCDRFRLDYDARSVLFHQVLSGLAHAHRKGIVHRDVKASNVMVTVRDGEAVAKVIDFGIAKSLGPSPIEEPAKTQIGLPIGTPDAMSPEQAAGLGALEASSDVYSLGVLAYRLLAGLKPKSAEAEPRPRPASASLAELPPSERLRIAAARGTTPDELERRLTAVDSCLAKAMSLDPTRRFADASELADALIDAEARASKPPDVAMSRRWPAALLLLASLVGLWVWQGATSRNAPEREPVLEGSTSLGSAAPAPDASDPSAGPEALPLALPATGQGVPLAVTIDDLPSSADLPWPELEAVTDALLTQLADHGVSAMGFVNSGKLEPPSEYRTRVDLLRRWLDGGHDLGNHTATHPSLHDIPPADYLRDIENGEPVLERLLGERDRELRWFRHPFLRVGRTVEMRSTVDSWLAAEGYTVAPVTLENTDWMFAAVYRRRLDSGDLDGARQVGEAYIDFSRRAFAFLEGVSEQLEGRAHAQILLLHANRLNADYFAQLAEMLKRRGYRFVSLPEAFGDPVYSRADTYAGSAGVVWQYHWAKTDGIAVDWLSEPEPPSWISEAFNRVSP